MQFGLAFLEIYRQILDQLVKDDDKADGPLLIGLFSLSAFFTKRDGSLFYWVAIFSFPLHARGNM